jgi:hypothetical protein
MFYKQRLENKAWFTYQTGCSTTKIEKGWSGYGTEEHILISAYSVIPKTKWAKVKKINITIKNYVEYTI